VMLIRSLLYSAFWSRLIICGIASVYAPTKLSSDRTKVVVLGVNHSVQLVSHKCQPTVFRAFFDPVAPDAMCVERPPQELLRRDFDERTYEVQYIAVPYARQKALPLYGFDWRPADEDQISPGEHPILKHHRLSAHRMAILPLLPSKRRT
jgi:hypothetical protein